MTVTELDLNTPLHLHPLTFLDEGEEVTVGRADIDSYGLFPPDGADLLRRLADGASPAEAARWYREEYGEDVDIAEFLEVIEELDLVVRAGEAAAPPRPVTWQRLGRAVFSLPAWLLFLGLIGTAGAEMLRNRTLVPHYQNLFFTRSSLTILTLGLVLGQVPWMLLHEGFHALAGRRLGLNSSLGIGRRFYYVVFTTALDGLVAVPRRKRYLPMLAGMLADVLSIAALTLGAAALDGSTGFPALLRKLFLSMAFGVVLRLAWQFYFFLRTDLYFLAVTVLGCNDLQTVSRQMLTNRLFRLAGRRDRVVDEATWTGRDRQVARWYSWLMIAGYLFLVTLIVGAMIPAAVRITEIAVHRLTRDLSALSAVDFVIFMFLNFGEFILAGYLALRAYRRRGQPSVSPSAS
jgi:hypothetical protein